MSIKSGILLINKPAGPSSHDIVNEVRKITGIKKVGHAGTLDPFASGLLVVLVGREATKKQKQFLNKDKEYLAKIHLGIKTDSYDKTGKETSVYDGILPTKEEVKLVLRDFKGELLQMPPAFSAKKVKGKKAYQLARQGKDVKLDPCKVEVKEIEFLKYASPIIELRILCSAGTYIRSLAHDLGQKLTCGAFLEELVRTKSGNFVLRDSVELETLNSANYSKYLISLEKI